MYILFIFTQSIVDYPQKYRLQHTFYWLVAISLITYFLLYFNIRSIFGPAAENPYPAMRKSLLILFKYGFITEYSTIYFSLILFTEYGNIIVLTYVIIIVFSIYPLPLLFFLYNVCLIRSTLNRLKFDELMTCARLVILAIIFSFLLLSLILSLLFINIILHSLFYSFERCI